MNTDMFEAVLDPTPGRNLMKVMKREIFDHYLKSMGYTRTQFKALFGMGDRVYHNTYNYHYHYPDRSERVAMGGKKIARSQRTKNSNSKNTGIPRVMLDKIRVEELLLAGESIDAISKHMGVAAATVRVNITYYEITLPEWYMPQRSIHLTQDVKVIDEFFGTSILLMQSPAGIDAASTLEVIQKLENDMREMELVIKRVKNATLRYATANGIKHSYRGTPGSKTNFLYGKAFSEEGCKIHYEFKVEDRLFDLYLPDLDTLVEIDPAQYHRTEQQTENDKKKDRLALTYGFKIVRIIAPRDVSYLTALKQAKECLQNLK